MRNAFADVLREEAKKDPSIMLLTGDLGYSVFERFQEELPNQYLNCGIMEQSMTGIAAGLAFEGYRPVIYSIIPFITMRNIEQLRNDICYHNLPVLIVGVGAGFSYGPYGYSHHSLEDIGMMRLLPNLAILAPGDPVEARELTRQALRRFGPVYLRLGKKGEPTYTTRPVELGKGNILQDGDDIAIFSTSSILEVAIEVARRLADDHIYAMVVSMHTLVPFDTNLLEEVVKTKKMIVTIEEHAINGGLGTIVAEYFADHQIAFPLYRVGVRSYSSHIVGTQSYVRKVHGVSPALIVEEIRNRYARVSSSS